MMADKQVLDKDDIARLIDCVGFRIQQVERAERAASAKNDADVASAYRNGIKRLEALKAKLGGVL